MLRSVVFPVPVPPLISRVLPLRNLLAQIVRELLAQRAASDQVIDGITPAGELPDGERRSRPHNRRNHCGEAATIWELRV